MSSAKDSWIGLDIGGANLKGVHSAGQIAARPFAVWRQPEKLSENLARLASELPDSKNVAVTMTAELCDCFDTKREGVQSILDAVAKAFWDQNIVVWCLDGRFHTINDVLAEPLNAAASNWLALAAVAARIVAPAAGLLIDIGSTTTDLIPFQDAQVISKGKSDTARLQTGELVYAGVRRTPLCALATEVRFRVAATGLAAELFATTLDVFLSLREISEDPDDRDTADGRPATRENARDRLARMVGADREGFDHDDARQLAETLQACLLSRLQQAAERVCQPWNGRPPLLILSGSGEFLAQKLASRLVGSSGTIVSLSQRWSKAASEAACAQALLELVGAEGLLP